MPELRIFNQSISPIIIVDTGILIEYFSGSEKGLKIKEMIFSNPFIVSVLITPLTLIEIYYILRRKNSKDKTASIIKQTKELTKLIPIDDQIELIGEIKSVTPFSLVDCSSIAVAENREVNVVFKHEKEIDKLLENRSSLPFTSRIVFIDDFSYYDSWVYSKFHLLITF